MFVCTLRAIVSNDRSLGTHSELVSNDRSLEHTLRAIVSNDKSLRKHFHTGYVSMRGDYLQGGTIYEGGLQYLQGVTIYKGGLSTRSDYL